MQTHGKRTARIVLGATASLGLALAGITAAAGLPAGAAARPGRSVSSAQLTTVSIGIAAPEGNLLLPLYAEQNGFFKKHGIDAKVVILTGGTILQALAGGAIQFASMGAPEPEEAVLNGTRMEWLASWDNRTPVQLIGAPGITSIKQLAGKPVGITAAGSTTDVLLGFALKEAGMSLSDVHIEPLGSQGSLNGAFVAGTIDAQILGPPDTELMLRAKPGSSVLVNFASKYAYPGGGAVAMSAYARSHKAVVLQVLAALSAALQSWRHNPSAAEFTIVGASPGTTAVEAKETYRTDIASINPSMLPSPAAERDVLRSLEVFPQFLAAARKARPAEFFDLAPLEQLNRG